MLDPKVQITKTKEVASFDYTDKPVLIIRTTWTYGRRHGPFTDDATKAGWTLDAFAERIAPHVRELAALGD
jgi:hypothetical protein